MLSRDGSIRALKNTNSEMTDRVTEILIAKRLERYRDGVERGALQRLNQSSNDFWKSCIEPEVRFD